MTPLQSGIKVCVKEIAVGVLREVVALIIDSQHSRIYSLPANELNTWHQGQIFPIMELRINPYGIFAVVSARGELLSTTIVESSGSTGIA